MSHALAHALDCTSPTSLWFTKQLVCGRPPMYLSSTAVPDRSMLRIRCGHS